eukprot:Clim_evm4s48 gene=Clim_evmTU4s48
MRALLQAYTALGVRTVFRSQWPAVRNVALRATYGPSPARVMHGPGASHIARISTVGTQKLRKVEVVESSDGEEVELSPDFGMTTSFSEKESVFRGMRANDSADVALTRWHLSLAKHAHDPTSLKEVISKHMAENDEHHQLQRNWIVAVIYRAEAINYESNEEMRDMLDFLQTTIHSNKDTFIQATTESLNRLLKANVKYAERTGQRMTRKWLNEWLDFMRHMYCVPDRHTFGLLAHHALRTEDPNMVAWIVDTIRELDLRTFDVGDKIETEQSAEELEEAFKDAKRQLATNALSGLGEVMVRQEGVKGEQDFRTLLATMDASISGLGYSAMIQAYADKEQIAEMMRLVHEMDDRDVDVDRHSVVRLMDVFENHGRLEELRPILQRWMDKEKNWESMYTGLVFKAAQDGRLNDALDLLEQAQELGVRCKYHELNSLLGAIVREGTWEQGVAVVKYMEAMKLQMSRKSYIYIINLMSSGAQRVDLDIVLNDILMKGIIINQDLIQRIFAKLAYGRKHIEQVLNFLDGNGFSRKMVTSEEWDLVAIRVLYRNGPLALASLLEFMERENVQPTPWLVHEVVLFLAERHSVASALELVKRIQKKTPLGVSPHTYRDLGMRALTMDSIPLVQSVFDVVPAEGKYRPILEHLARSKPRRRAWDNVFLRFDPRTVRLSVEQNGKNHRRPQQQAAAARAPHDHQQQRQASRARTSQKGDHSMDKKSNAKPKSASKGKTKHGQQEK